MDKNVSAPEDMSGYFQKDEKTKSETKPKRAVRKPRKKTSDEDIDSLIKQLETLLKGVKAVNKAKSRKEYYDAETDLRGVMRSLKSIKK